MSEISVVDQYGKPITVGATVHAYTRGGWDQYGKVTEISEPDIDDTDELHVKHGLTVTVEFDEGHSDEYWCDDVTNYVGPMDTWDDQDRTFQEHGDLTVIRAELHARPGYKGASSGEPFSSYAYTEIVQRRYDDLTDEYRFTEKIVADFSIRYLPDTNEIAFMRGDEILYSNEV